MMSEENVQKALENAQDMKKAVVEEFGGEEAPLTSIHDAIKFGAIEGCIETLKRILNDE